MKEVHGGNMRKNVLIGLSGGPSTAINASMAGVIRAAAASARYGAVSVSYTHLRLNEQNQEEL